MVSWHLLEAGGRTEEEVKTSGGLGSPCRDPGDDASCLDGRAGALHAQRLCSWSAALSVRAVGGVYSRVRRRVSLMVRARVRVWSGTGSELAL